MYNFTDKQYELRNVDIDLRFQTNLLTDEFGIDILYIRNCKFVRCKCFDDLNKTGDPNCRLCHGSGFFASIQKIKAIESSNSAYSSTSSIIQTPLGATDQKNEVYYIEYKYTPKIRDFLLKVTWKDGYPVDVLQVLEIVNIWEHRGDQGRAELYACLINDRTDMVSMYNEAIKRLPRRATLELLRGGKYIWPMHLVER